MNETVPLFMDEGEESATHYMADKDEDPPSLAVVEGPQPPSNNVEEHPGRSTIEEELQSERRKIIQLEIKLECSTAEIRFLKDKLQRQSYCRDRYSASQLSERVHRMETGLLDKDTFSAVCEYVVRFEDSITYYSGWRSK